MAKNTSRIGALIDSQNKLINTLKNDIIDSTNRLTSYIASNVHTNNVSTTMIDDFPSSNKLIEIFHRIKSIANDDLYSNMGAAKACRIAIYLFHNGTKTFNGLSFLKISCVGEKMLSGSGIKERIVKHTNMSVNILDDMYEEIVNNGRYLIINNETDADESSEQEFISSNKIKYAQLVCIYDAENNALGFISAEFDHEYNKTIADEEFEILKDFSNKLSPVLSFTNYAELTVLSKYTKP